MASSGQAILAPNRPPAGARDVLDSPEATRLIIQGSALRSVAYVLTVLANLAALPLLFRHLGVDDSGRYVTVLTVCTLVGAGVETGFGAISVREYARRTPEDRHNLMADLIAIRGTALIVSACVAFGFLVAAGYPVVIVAGTAIGLAGALFEALSSTYSVWLTTSLRLGRLALLQIVRQSVAVALTLGLIALDAPLPYFFGVLALAGGAQAAAAVIATHGKIPHLPALDWARCRALLRTSAPFIAGMALSVLYFRMAMILMPVLSSETQTGYLGVPFRLLEIITLVSVLVLSSAFPVVARAAGSDRARHHYALRRMSEVSIILGLFVGIVAFVGAPLIVRILGGAEFEPATKLLRILAIALAAKFVIAAWAFSLLSLDRHRAVLWANALATVLALTLSLTLVPIFDATGGAVATAAADCAVLLSYGWALQRAPDAIELPWLRFGLLLLVSAAAAAAFLLPLPAVAQVAVAAGIFAAGVWRTKLLPEEIVRALPQPGALFSGGR